MNVNLKHPHYIGRFAPSPTGPLHFGSLVTATASYLDAKANRGSWIVRMEDIDKQREVPGAAEDILQTLISFGFEWQGEVLYQSRRKMFYAEHLQHLLNANQAYPCSCSRKQIQLAGQQRHEGSIYPGTCRTGFAGEKPRSWRLKVDDTLITFEDVIQGHHQQMLSEVVGDFVLKRADGFFAYQLAVVVDDAFQGVTHIVRGADLLDSTARQIFLQRQLGFSTPSYAHIPVATYPNGDKLSKQNRAQPVKYADTAAVLMRVLQFLGLHPPREFASAALADIWQWAVAHWQINNVVKTRHQVSAELP